MCWRGPASVSLLVVPGMQFRRRRLGKKRNVCIDQDIEPPNLGFAICSAARDWRRVLVSPPVRVHGVAGPEMNRWKDFFFFRLDARNVPRAGGVSYRSANRHLTPANEVIALPELALPEAGANANKKCSAIQAKPSLALCLARRFWVLFAYLLSSQSLWLSLLPAATAADRCSFARSLRT